VAFDKTPCARCGMLISDPRFAAQLQTREGRVLHFDDPGCLLLYEHERAPDARASYFHDAHSERWIPRASVAFAPLEPSPMGYGLAAQERGAAGELSWAQALERALARDAARRRG
jgi:copper chaperone NosL